MRSCTWSAGIARHGADVAHWGCIGTRKTCSNESSTTNTTSKELAQEFIEKLDAALPEEHKLPRDEDGSFNLRAKDQGKLRDGTKKYAGFNINSPKQLVDKLKLSWGKPQRCQWKTSASRQAFGLMPPTTKSQIYLEWKRCEKRRQMIESIQEKMDKDGFVRASYMQLGAESGRMSCVKPNNQQIPRDPQFRGCVEAPDGYLFGRC